LRIQASNKTISKNTFNKLNQQLQCQSNSISFLKLENCDLKTTTTLKKKKCLDLERQIDRVTETYKKKLDSQINKVEILETQLKTSNYKVKHFENEDQYLNDKIIRLEAENLNLKTSFKASTDKIKSLGNEGKHTAEALRKLDSQNSRLKQDVAFLSAKAEESKPTTASLPFKIKEAIKCAREETISSHTNLVNFRDRVNIKTTSCKKCGSQAYHGNECPAQQLKGRCGYCDKKGHFTMMCTNINKLINK
jgi:chromosome segregation ATPase